MPSFSVPPKLPSDVFCVEVSSGVDDLIGGAVGGVGGGLPVTGVFGGVGGQLSVTGVLGGVGG